MWDVRGWQGLTVHDDPPLVAAREEFLAWLEEVPEPHKTNWKRRLTSDLEHPHLSVRLELFLHHYFKQRSWAVEIEPDMEGNPHHPDFLLGTNGRSVMVEAKTVLEREGISQQNQRLAQLCDSLSKRLSGQVILHPLSNLPPSLAVRRIIPQIERRLKSNL